MNEDGIQRKLQYKCKIAPLLLFIMVLSIFMTICLIIFSFFQFLFSTLIPHLSVSAPLFLSFIFFVSVFLLSLVAGFKFLDVFLGQWIYRLWGLNFRTAFLRVIWIYMILGACIIIYFSLDLKFEDKKDLVSTLKSVCNSTDEKFIFIFDNCVRKEYNIFIWLIGGFIALLAAFQAEFVSKYRLLHELRKSYVEKSVNCCIDDNFLYYVEHCYLFELWDNNSFKRDVDRCISLLSQVSQDNTFTYSNMYNRGYKRIATELCLKNESKLNRLNILKKIPVSMQIMGLE